MELDPKRLLVLHALAETGGVAPAARRLKVTPSAVSQALARLEQQARLPLLDRSGGRIELTAAGRALAARGRRIADELDGAARDLAESGGPVAGAVAIGAVPRYVPVVCRAVAVLAERYPGLRPTVREDLAAGAADLGALRNGLVDILVTVCDSVEAPPTPAGTEYQIRIEEQYRVVVPAGWPVPTGFAELDGVAWITGEPGSAYARALDRLVAAHGFTPARLHVATTTQAAQVMLAAGLGAALLSSGTAATMRGIAVSALPVPGARHVRCYYRIGVDGPSPAVQATVTALHEATLLAAEAVAELGVLEQDPFIKPGLGTPRR
ncbi:LysR family transcriptional regulator [Streptacidiphilus sp. P02-A3a]|uniref:LysR family transcriptional regulator n=1 Tax=Streptacidiphilus sp. P02-A3a TaxID=2704468 RepID=UPI0015FD1818|nr:LysR family transcriptional regulator [Streptacidiphilus sp. P02-A3a]QMU71425.1 LysR family transcriptional regulator [Streptacidiphilus sp. P02-A3a]